jgi:ATP-dependent Clp protease ATP-binding subunit ClpA
MARVIQAYIKKPLAEDILFGRLAKGGEVHVSVKNDNLILELEEEAVH